MDYHLWQQTIYCHFGQKWSILHHGPMWHVTQSLQGYEGQSICSNATMQRTMEVVHDMYIVIIILFSTLQALVNIPANSERTLQQDISAGGVTITPEIQVGVLYYLFF